MAHDHTRILRRWPVFEFAVQASISGREAEDRLRLACASQNPDAAYPEPKWVGEDDRLFGDVGGQVFTLTTGRGSGGRAPGPVIMGYIVPESAESCMVVVRVRNRHWWSVVWTVFWLTCGYVLAAEAVGVRDAGMLAFAAAAWLAGTFGWQIVEGNRVLRMLSEILW